MSDFVRHLVQDKNTISFNAQARYAALPSDSDAYAADFGYPNIVAGVTFNKYNRVTLHRNKHFDPELPETADYNSRLGNIITFYTSFERPISRTRHWETDYTFNFGIGLTNRKYNPDNCVDNMMIGSYALIYFGTGLHATYHPVPEWGIRTGVEFHHHSNGTLGRPNNGSNTLGPTFAVLYTPSYAEQVQHSKISKTPFDDRHWYLNFTLGIAPKTLYEDWMYTQYSLKPGDDGYRTEDFTHFMAYSLQADFMRRYARRWASGVGLDIFYGTHIDHLKRLNKKKELSESLSPWSIGIAGKHEVFYHQFSMNMELGVYLFRKMGSNAKGVEQPFYERIGLRYRLPHMGGLTIGGNVKAHALRADFTEFTISQPIRL